MEQIVEMLKDSPVFSQFDQWTLQYIAGLAKRKRYKPKEWLFHQSTPRKWLGIVERGDIRIIAGSDEKHTCLAILKEGGVISERILVEDLPHTVSCFTQEGAVIIRWSRGSLEKIRKDHPDVHCRIVACASALIRDWMRYAVGHPTIENVLPLKRDSQAKDTQSIWSILGKN